MSEAFVGMMKRTASLLGNDEFEVEEGNHAVIGVEDVLISFQYLDEAEQILIFGDILELPKENRDIFYEMLLEGQFFFEKTQGFTLAINKDLNIVLLQTALSIHTLDENILLRIMENFMHVAVYWREELAPFYNNQADIIQDGQESQVAMESFLKV